MEELLKIQYGEYLKSFNLKKVEKLKKGYQEEFGDEIRITFEEKASKKPQENLVKNGKLNMLELIDHPVGGQITYLRFLRQRWKDPHTQKEYYNNYDFQFPGTKLTVSFALFLKSEDRKKVNELFVALPHLWNTIQKDFFVVQKSNIGI